MATKKKNDIVVLEFAEKTVPEYKETTSSKKYVNYGGDNKFPDYLLWLYGKSPKHGSIVKGKAHYVAGKGVEFKDKQNDSLNDALKIVNRHGEGLNSINRKVSLDQEIFNGFCLQVIWGRGGKITDIIHLHYHKVRSNEDNTMFYYKKNGWVNPRGAVQEFPAFNPLKRTGSQVLYFKDYRAGIDTYTLPDYINSLEYIESDILVSGHMLNNANCGFTGSKMVSFNDGEPEDEEKEEIERRMNDKFTGKKGSKIVINFSASAAVAPTILDLGASDLSKENLEPVDKLISQNIFTGHQVVSPMLFGVRVEGQLGGRNEIREAYEIFKNTYVNAKQQNVEEVYNTLLSINGLPECRIVPVEPIGYEFSEATIKEVAPKGYILEKIGINPNDYKEYEKLSQPTEQPENKSEKFSDLDDDFAVELFSQIGDTGKDFFRVKSRKVRFASDEDCKRSELQGYREAFAEITQLESNIIDLLRKDKRATPEVIAKALQVDTDLVKDVLRTLDKKGLVKVSIDTSNGGNTTVREITPDAKIAVEEKRPMTTEVFIRYSYEGVKDDRNRKFCARMLELDKIYSRGEIEQISQRLGYSVWERRGGFYHNPNTGETTPFCRHYWMQHIVIKKK